MCQTTINLVQFGSLDPEVDPLTGWIYNLGFLDSRVDTIIRGLNNFMPIDIETEFRQRLGLPLVKPTRTLFNKLLQSENGLNLKEMGLSDGGWGDSETCTGKLIHLSLARVQDNSVLKATKVAFDPRVQFLIGILKQAPDRE